MFKRIFIGVIAVLGLATAPLLAQERLLFDAGTRNFVLHSGNSSTGLGRTAMPGWTAYGLTPQEALDLTALLADPRSLSDADAQRLENFTSNRDILYPFEPIPEAVVVPEFQPALPVFQPVTVSIDFAYVLPRRPTCPQGTLLPRFCDREAAQSLRICSCDF